MIKITLKNDVKEFKKGITPYEIAKEISEGLARQATSALVNGKIYDLRESIDQDAEVEILTFDSEKGKDAYRHTSAHILAQAVKRLYPKTVLAIGPSIKNGFYYDFDREEPFTEEDLENIEKEMKKIIKEGFSIEKFTLPKEEAIALMKKEKEDYKVELIEELPEGETISFYKQGEFTDLCAGPHLMNTKGIKSIKLMSVAGAYWKGNEKNKMLSRIYGTSFSKASDLQAYLTMLEEAKKRDHRKLGKELELFALLDEGPGFPFFLPKGMIIKNLLIDYWREIHKRAGYVEISTPIILNTNLWMQSGHWDLYKENMYFTEIDDMPAAIKPMNCPGGMLVYKQKMHSYRDLPLRCGELGLVHRHEKSGALMGLMRVRAFTQDDAHIFMTPDQIKTEIENVIHLIDEVYNLFGFSYEIELSTRPEESMGSEEAWEMATGALEETLKKKGLAYKINEGDGAFYGPKIDFHLKDSIGRTWQCGTIQLDFQMPERFELEYVEKDGSKARPVMIHRVLFGSIERFIGILIEHYAGQFPLWLSPVQVKILPISDKYHGYAEKIQEMLKAQDIRVESDFRAEKIGYKIREARNERVPYLFILGEKEETQGEISVRSRQAGEEGSFLPEVIIERILKEIKEKKQ